MNTSSADFPTINPLQAAYGGGLNDAFVAKLNPSGTRLVYSTYLGGSGNDVAFAVAVDPSGFAYVAGRTASLDFPTANPLQRTYAGGPSDCFVAKLNAEGSMLVYSTYLGGSGNLNENIFGIAADAAGNAYVSGFTNSLDFPIVNAFQPSYGGGNSDAFTAKLNATGSALVYSSYLSGRDADRGDYIVLDAAGNVYMIGWTASIDFPTRNPFQATFGGSTFDAFVVKLGVDDRPTTIAIVSAAGFNTSPVASESIVAAFGVGFVNRAATTVRVKDSSGTERSAPVFFVSQNQINFQIPQGTVSGTATVTVFDYNAAIAVGSVQITP